MERHVHDFWWKSIQLHPRRWSSGTDLYHLKWKKKSLPDSTGRLLGAVAKGDRVSWGGVEALEFHPSSQVHCCWAQMEVDLFAVAYFFDLWLPGVSSLAPTRPRNLIWMELSGSTPASTYATWWEETGPHTTRPQAPGSPQGTKPGFTSLLHRSIC